MWKFAKHISRLTLIICEEKKTNFNDARYCHIITVTCIMTVV